MKIYAYKLGSETAKKVAKELGVLIVKPNGRFKNNHDHKIINWGSTEIPKWKHDESSFLNHPSKVINAVNKILTLQTLLVANIPHVEFTADRSTAQRWLEDSPVVVRKVVNGYGGRGVEIVIEGELPQAPLYTKFIPKSREYRFHVFNGKIIDVQQKKRRSGTTPDGLIKNLANGWVFCRDDITEPPETSQQVALDTIKALGLDFGSVDMLSKNGEVFVLEVNTASGMENTTLEKYINELKHVNKRTVR